MEFAATSMAYPLQLTSRGNHCFSYLWPNSVRLSDFPNGLF